MSVAAVLKYLPVAHSLYGALGDLRVDSSADDVVQLIGPLFRNKHNDAIEGLLALAQATTADQGVTLLEFATGDGLRNIFRGHGKELLKYAPMVSMLYDAATELQVGLDVEELLDVIGPIVGADHAQTARAFIEGVQAVSLNPEETFAEFVNGGGLIRLLSGQTAEQVHASSQPIGCPHCGGMLIL